MGALTKFRRSRLYYIATTHYVAAKVAAPAI